MIEKNVPEIYFHNTMEQKSISKIPFQYVMI